MTASPSDPPPTVEPEPVLLRAARLYVAARNEATRLQTERDKIIAGCIRSSAQRARPYHWEIAGHVGNAATYDEAVAAVRRAVGLNGETKT